MSNHAPDGVDGSSAGAAGRVSSFLLENSSSGPTDGPINSFPRNQSTVQPRHSSRAARRPRPAAKAFVKCFEDQARRRVFDHGANSSASRNAERVAGLASIA
jgi:hypothetical protein